MGQPGDDGPSPEQSRLVLDDGQFGQTALVLDHFQHKRGGTYVEIGVYDGVRDNNTARLDVEYGWTGLCIDPLAHNMQDRTCTRVPYAVGGSGHGAVVFKVDGGLSGVEGVVDSDENAMWKCRMEEAPTVTTMKLPIGEVLDNTLVESLGHAPMPREIDYLSLDCEGCEVDVLTSGILDTHCFRFATIEINDDPGKRETIRSLMIEKGYTPGGEVGVDDVFTNPCSGG